MEKELKKIFVFGKNPVIELVKMNKRPVFSLYIQSNRVSEYKKLLPPNNIRINRTSKEKLHNLLQRSDHQGIIAETTEFEYCSFSSISDISDGFILCPEGVTDPQNLGSMIRSAVLLGAKGIMIPSKFSAGVTEIVTHTSAGATEHIAITRVDSFTHNLFELRKRGFTVIGAFPPDNLVHNPEFHSQDIRDVDISNKVAIVMGSEGYGIKSKTLKACSDLAYIPQAGNLDSFSVSAATSIMAFVISQKLKVI